MRLVADIGGTNARFALAGPDGRLQAERRLAVADFPGLAEAAESYLGGRKVEEAVIAVATPIETDEVRLTNAHWRFSVSGLGPRLGIPRLAVINDFVAQAFAVLHLSPGDWEPVGGGESVPGRAIGVLGAGTGLGVSALVPTNAGWVALPTEGGHTTLIAETEEERAVRDWLGQRFGHISNERVLSGPGLLNLAEALAGVSGGTTTARTPADVSAFAGNASCPYCVSAVRIFSALLGAFAGNLALVYGARGGIYVTGGVGRQLGPLFDRDAFRRRFTDKGRMSAYLDPIPTRLVKRDETGLLGAAFYPVDQ
ncbi:MAG: glucokinase [Geminicoccaceae bacterium]